jgi:hypothetical protein
MRKVAERSEKRRELYGDGNVQQPLHFDHRMP